MRSPSLLAAALALSAGLMGAHASPANHQKAAGTKDTPGPSAQGGGKDVCVTLHAQSSAKGVALNDNLVFAKEQEDKTYYALVGPKAAPAKTPKAVLRISKTGTVTGYTPDGPWPLVTTPSANYGGKLIVVYLIKQVTNDTPASVNLGKQGAFSIAGVGQNLACLTDTKYVTLAAGDIQEEDVAQRCGAANVKATVVRCPGDT